MSGDPRLDLLAFGAHPDDIELGCGGLLAKCSRAGRAVGVVDLTLGEGASRGSVAERQAEAAESAALLGLTVRENLRLPDLHLEDTLANREAVAEVIRRYRADLVLVCSPQDRHPDHAAASSFVTHGAFLARLPKIVTASPPHAPVAVLYYLIHENLQPSFVVDISDVWEVKRAAVACYRSQFDQPMPPGYRFVGTADYHAATAARAGFWGAQIQVAQGEAYLTARPLRLDDPVGVLLQQARGGGA
ncbi:MAG: bacillithiol biosynthesis deacetylase BshB1 [Fimbriimonadaceae bacterium]|nr:bacillithiol biosynthesis deacetylase BshB1 [Fimbriimonadaceae bacterium]